MSTRTSKQKSIAPPYLTEDNLQGILKQIFPGTCHFEKNKRFYYGGRRYYEADFYCMEKKIIVEFDGSHHYTQTKVILQDSEKDKYFKEQGIQVIRIPYFVQIDRATILTLFSLESNVRNNYPHGFISEVSTCTLPADYCELGIQRFKDDLNKFSCIRNDIIISLKNRKEFKNTHNPYSVLPPSLSFILDWM